MLVKNALFRNINGYSNGYFGWGGEDDDFGLRLMRQVGRSHSASWSATELSSAQSNAAV